MDTPFRIAIAHELACEKTGKHELAAGEWAHADPLRLALQ